MGLLGAAPIQKRTVVKNGCIEFSPAVVIDGPGLVSVSVLGPRLKSLLLVEIILRKPKDLATTGCH